MLVEMCVINGDLLREVESTEERLGCEYCLVSFNVQIG